MEIFVFKFEGPISNNKGNRMFAPLLGTPLAKKISFWISLIYMEILVFKFERPISNNKENKMFAPPPDTPLTKIYIFSISLNKYKKINIYISNVYLV